MSSSTQSNTAISSPASSPDGTIQLKIMSPSPGVPPNLSYRVQPTATVAHLKALIKDSLASRPLSDQQKLIYRGKILQGSSTIGESLIGNVSSASRPKMAGRRLTSTAREARRLYSALGTRSAAYLDCYPSCGRFSFHRICRLPGRAYDRNCHSSPTGPSWGCTNNCRPLAMVSLDQG
jgi:hypothetical protein